MEEKMKKVSRRMNIYMSLAMSICLSIVGVLNGNITKIIAGFVPASQLVVSILTSFLISLLISLVIGFLVPIHKVCGAASKNMKPGIGKRCVESLISDLIYTPVMTLAMTLFAYIRVMRSSGGTAELHYLPMFLASLVVCMVFGFVLIYIFTPAFLKKAMKAEGVEQPPQG